MKDRDYILFEDYLSQSLDESERQAFEERLKEDSDFQEAFEIYKKTSDFLDHKFSNASEREALKENISKISKTYSDSTPSSSKKTPFYQPWKLAIAASLLVIMGVFYSQWFKTPTYEDFAEYPEISLSVRGESKPLKLEAEKAFNSENFEQVIPLFKSILQQEPENLEIQLYLAIAHVENNNFKEADSIFSKLLETSNAYLNQIRWYAALSKLKQENYQETKAYLEGITPDAMTYTQAQNLLNRLD